MTRPESRSPLALGLFSYILFFLIVPIILYHAELPPFPGGRRFIYFVLLGPFAALWTHGSVFVMAMLAMMILPLWIALLANAARRVLWASLCGGMWLLFGSVMAVSLT